MEREWLGEKPRPCRLPEQRGGAQISVWGSVSRGAAWPHSHLSMDLSGWVRRVQFRGQKPMKAAIHISKDKTDKAPRWALAGGQCSPHPSRTNSRFCEALPAPRPAGRDSHLSVSHQQAPRPQHFLSSWVITSHTPPSRVSSLFLSLS